MERLAPTWTRNVLVIEDEQEVAKLIKRHLQELSCTVDDITIDPEKREVAVRGRNIDLTSKEFELLLHFMQNPGRAYSRAQLLDMVWGYSHEGYEHAINCHINRLRAKIEENHAAPKHLLTVWGVGYKFSRGDPPREA